MKFKQCTACKTWFLNDFEYFYWQNKKKPHLGYTYECKKCNTKRSSKYNKEHSEWYQNYKKEYEAAVPGRRKEYYKNYHLENKEERNQYTKEYQQNNPNKLKIYTERRKHKNHKINKTEWKSCKEYFNNECAFCGITEQEHRNLFNQDLHKEHAIHDGANDLSNCIPSCQVCNHEKFTSDYVDWYNSNNPKYQKKRLDKIIQWLQNDYKLFIRQQVKNGIV